jgi:PhnB protein
MEKASKKKSVRAVPEGFHTVTPYLMADNASGLIEFIKNAFNGKETFNMKSDDGKIMHATVQIGNSTIMISDVMEDQTSKNAMLFLYVADVDAVYKKALQANATSTREPKDEFYGDRTAAINDEFGNVWWIATHVEDVDQKELEKRSQQELQNRKEKGHVVHA